MLYFEKKIIQISACIARQTNAFLSFNFEAEL